MQPVKLLRLQVLEEEGVASHVLDVRPQSTADQDGAYDGLRETQAQSVSEPLDGTEDGGSGAPASP